MSVSNMRTAIGAIIDNGKILLVRKRQTWILPGGKPESSESDIECLCREISEELPDIKLDNIRYYGEFEGITPHKNDTLRTRVYFADIGGNLCKAGAEISEYSWIKDTNEYNLSDITLKIVDSLRINGYL